MENKGSLCRLGILKRLLQLTVVAHMQTMHLALLYDDKNTGI